MNRSDYILSLSAPTYTPTAFSQSVMQQITSSKKTMRFATPWRRIAFALTVIMAVTLLGFTSYAYAIGTDPVTLIRRWISGQTVMINYDGREFSHGVKLTYSDAAITAAAELNLLDMAHFHDANAMQVPHGGVEYVDDPLLYGSDSYIYPKLAYVTNKTDNTVEIHEVFVRGDKMTPSGTVDATYTVPSDTIIFRKNLDASTLPLDQPVLVSLYRDHYRRHTTGSGAETTPVTMSFAYTLSQPLENYIEASQNSPAQGKMYGKNDVIDEGLQPLIESHLGALASICLNNGADTCTYDDKTLNGELSLYGQDDTLYGLTNRTNHDAIAQGEGVADGMSSRQDLIMRSLQGTIISIDTSSLRVKTSSGAIWTLAFDQARQQAFVASYKKKLAVGNRLSASVYQSISELDARSIGHTFIYQMTLIK